jgi:putative DNA primase/helicase
VVKLDQAIAYAERGFAVFPVFGIGDSGKCLCGGSKACGENAQNAGKHPITPRGLLDATTNIKQVKVWWQSYPEANIGIATGEVSGLVVLDIDGPKGFNNLEGRALPTTPSVTSGRTDGGLHLYFQHPGGKVKNTVKKLGENIHIRGDGGYIIAPPSRHVSGAEYQWAESLDCELAELPKWVKDAVDEASMGLDTSLDGEILLKGGRNIYLTSLAGSVRKRGGSEAEIYATISVRNAERCDPPLADDELRKIASSVANYERGSLPEIRVTINDSALGDVVPTEECRSAAHTDVGNAEAFVSLYGDHFRYDHTRRKWLVWAEHATAWADDTNEAHRRGMVATLRARQSMAQMITDDAERRALQNWARKCETGQHMTNALRIVQSMQPIAMRTEAFDTHPNLLNFLNGTLDLVTEEFRPAERTDYLTRVCAVDFSPGARAPLWEKFLTEIFHGDEQIISYVQRALGYCLAGETAEHAFFIAYGHGANGKSTLLNTVRRALGNYSTVTAFRTFDMDNKNEYGNDLAILKGTRLVTAIEAEANKRLAEARVKTVTGGDSISCRFLYGEFFEMEPQFKVWLAVNHKPIIRGTDYGIWRRVHLIPFTQAFGDKLGELPIDRSLHTKLWQELPGIVNWLIDGYTSWRANGLQPPLTVVEATKEYREESDYVEQWLSDRITRDEGAKLKAQEGYNDFKQYLLDIGEMSERNIPSLRVWGQSMTEKGLTKTRVTNGYLYHGLKLVPMRLSDERAN